MRGAEVLTRKVPPGRGIGEFGLGARRSPGCPTIRRAPARRFRWPRIPSQIIVPPMHVDDQLLIRWSSADPRGVVARLRGLGLEPKDESSRYSFRSAVLEIV